MKLLSEYIAELNSLLKAEGDLPIATIDRDGDIVTVKGFPFAFTYKGKVADYEGSEEKFLIV